MDKNDEKMLIAVQRLVELNEAQTQKMVPAVQDIPRLKLRKDRVFTASFSYQAPNVTSNSTSESIGAITFALSNVPSFTNWTASFDSYRIIRAYVEFVPFGISAAANATLGQISTVIDYDDATGAFRSDLLQYDSLLIVDTGKYFERRLIPRAAKALYSGTAFTSYGQDEMPWIDADSSSVPHYGIKYSQSISSSANTGYSPLVTLLVNFRNND